MAKEVTKKMASFAIFLFLIIAILMTVGSIVCKQTSNSFYQKGIENLDNFRYAKACSYFYKAGEFKNSEFYYKHALAYSKSESASISAKVSHTAVLRKNGTVVCVGYQEKGCFCLDTYEFKDIIAVSTGAVHTVGLRCDGSVVATKFEENSPLDKGQCDVENWEQIVQISANSFYTLGLTVDGKVKFTGEGKNLEQVRDWEDIVAISAGGNFALGLKSDGTVVSTKPDNQLENFGQSDVGDWENVAQISAGQFHAVAVLKDGTVRAVGNNEHSQTNVSSLKNVSLACATNSSTYAVTKSGELLCVGKNFVDSNLSHVVAICGGNDFVCMVLENGTRKGFGENSHNQHAIEGIQK